MYLRKSPEGVGLILKNVEGKVVIREFKDRYKELQAADENNDLQINDVMHFVHISHISKKKKRYITAAYITAYITVSIRGGSQFHQQVRDVIIIKRAIDN